ncbi:MAG: hypothetical protein JXR76_01275 [Deltaproteobacteria bacterium]|nr:hypothetical protein [Deltaproteobacteria bacterium]
MCSHLLELRNKKEDQQMFSDCVNQAQTEEVTKKQARCRIYAVNKQEYWIRCRTGEPRSPDIK